MHFCLYTEYNNINLLYTGSGILPVMDCFLENNLKRLYVIIWERGLLWKTRSI